MNLSFAGCGFLGIYHVGVAVCFKKYAPHILLNKISGASAGSLAACCLLCDLPLGDLTSDFFRIVKEARSHSLGPFSPRFSMQMSILEGLQKFLPVNAHEIVNGRLHISMTRVYDGKNVIISQFNNREDLLQALLCACFIPFFSGVLPPRFHGVRYMDGGFSDNLPTLDENTITVSPFCGECDICPRDNSPQLLHVNWANTSIELSKQNATRMGRILFPPKPEAMSAFCQQGFDDALNFLHRNNLISCTRCLAVQSTFIVSEQTKEAEIEYDPDCSSCSNACKDCDNHRKEALDGNMPESVVKVFQTAIEQANQGVMNWIFKHRGAKLLTALALPAIVPADIMYASLTKILFAAPSITEQLKNFSDYFFNKATPKMRKEVRRIIESKHEQHTHCHKRESPISQNDDVDAFEHILAVTKNHDHIYAYFYTDENNKVKVTEIFDCSESDDPAIQSNDEREVNQLLEYDVMDTDFIIRNSHSGRCLNDNSSHEFSTSDDFLGPSFLTDDTLSNSSDPEVDQQHINSNLNILPDNVRNILESNSSNYTILDDGL